MKRLSKDRDETSTGCAPVGKRRTAVQVSEPYYSLLVRLVALMRNPDAEAGKQVTVKSFLNAALEDRIKAVLKKHPEWAAVLGVEANQ